MTSNVIEPLCSVDYVQTDHGNFVCIRYHEHGTLGEYVIPAMKFKQFIEKEGKIQKRGDPI